MSVRLRLLAVATICCLGALTGCGHNESQRDSTPQPSLPPSTPPAQNDSIFSEVNNQLSVVELGKRLEQVKAIEREARRMASLRRRQNWMVGISQCMRMLDQLKPRARAISDEYKRMLSPAGSDIVGAAMNLVGCINCLEDDDDDCRYARDFINKAERDLKREMRQQGSRNK